MSAFTTVVIPANNEGRNLVTTIQELSELYGGGINVIVVVDSEKDLSIAYFKRIKKPKSYNLVINRYGPGPANAIRYGIDQATTQSITVMMADGSDDCRAILELSTLVRRGVAVACASRYMLGGQQIGARGVKRFLSSTAGKSLFILAGIGTHDPTNSFKTYSRDFISKVGIQSRSGFELGIELVAKAHRHRLPIAEIPTIWIERKSGNSSFRIARWLPKYLRWYFYCFGPKSKVVDNRAGGVT